MKVDYEYLKGILFVRLKGKLNKHNSDELENYLIPVILRKGIKYIVFNLYDLASIDNRGIHVLETGLRAVEANNGTAYMCEVPNNLNELLSVTKINKVISELKAIELFNI